MTLKGVFTNLFSDIKGSVYEVKVFFSSHEFNVILKWLLRIYLVILKGVFTNLFSDIKGSVHEVKVFFFLPNLT